MGTTYEFYCMDCQEVWDIDKEHNAARFLPVLQKRHEGHRTGFCSEHDDISEMVGILYWVDGLVKTYKCFDPFADEEMKALPAASEAEIEAFYQNYKKQDEANDKNYYIIREQLWKDNPHLRS